MHSYCKSSPIYGLFITVVSGCSTSQSSQTSAAPIRIATNKIKKTKADAASKCDLNLSKRVKNNIIKHLEFAPLSQPLYALAPMEKTLKPLRQLQNGNSGEKPDSRLTSRLWLVWFDGSGAKLRWPAPGKRPASALSHADEEIERAAGLTVKKFSSDLAKNYP